MFHGIGAWLLVWFFPTSVFGVGGLFPDLCLLVPFVNIQHCYRSSTCIFFKNLRLIPKMMIQYIQRDLTNLRIL